MAESEETEREQIDAQLRTLVAVRAEALEWKRKAQEAQAELKAAKDSGVSLSHGYACFWDTAFGPWAMFHEKKDAVSYALRQVALKGTRMYLLLRSNGVWEKEPCWDSSDLSSSEASRG